MKRYPCLAKDTTALRRAPQRLKHCRHETLDTVKSKEKMKDDAARDGNFGDLGAIAEQPDQRPGKNDNGCRIRNGKRNGDRDHEFRNLHYTDKVARAPTEPQDSLRADTEAGDRQRADRQDSYSYSHRRDELVTEPRSSSVQEHTGKSG